MSKHCRPTATDPLGQGRRFYMPEMRPDVMVLRPEHFKDKNLRARIERRYPGVRVVERRHTRDQLQFNQRTDDMNIDQEELLLTVARVLRAELHGRTPAGPYQRYDVCALDKALAPFDGLKSEASPADDTTDLRHGTPIWRKSDEKPAFKALQPQPFDIRRDGRDWQWTPYPGWHFVPVANGLMRREKIPVDEVTPITGDVQTVRWKIPDGKGEKWVDIPRIQRVTLDNRVIERCASALEQEAVFNRRVAADQNDNLEIRAKAEHTADIKMACAEILRTLKEI